MNGIRTSLDQITTLTPGVTSPLETYLNLNEEPTCVGDRQPPSQEVEGPIGGVGHVARQCFKVGLSGQPAHKLCRVRVELAVVQSV